MLGKSRSSSLSNRAPARLTVARSDRLVQFVRPVVPLVSSDRSPLVRTGEICVKLRRREQMPIEGRRVGDGVLEELR